MFPKYMKSLIFFLVFIFLAFQNTYSQKNTKDTKVIDSLILKIKEFVPNNNLDLFNNKKKLTKNLSDKEIKKFEDFLYKSYAYHPIELEKKFDKWHDDWAKTGISGVKPPDGINPYLRKYKIRDILIKEHGFDYVLFLETPYFIKFKILNIKSSIYVSYSDTSKTLPQIDMKAEILEVIKGNSFYKKEQIITVSYLPLWYANCDCPINFESGEVYVIPLKPWHYKLNRDLNNLSIKNNGMNYFFKIENNIVSTHFVNDVIEHSSWKSFKQKFINKFNIKN